MNPDQIVQGNQGSDSQVPPHFHKEYRISEADLIPDGTTVSALPKTAPEGTEVSLYSGGVFTRYKMIDGLWRPIGSSSFPLVAYQENASASSVIISGLNLDADLAYKIIMQAYSATTDDAVNLRLNNDNSNLYNQAHIGYPGTDAFSTGNTEIWATENVDFRQVQSEMLLTNFNNVSPLMRINSLTVNGAGQPYVIDSSWRYLSGDNITSIRFYTQDSNNFHWRFWIYKLATS